MVPRASCERFVLRTMHAQPIEIAHHLLDYLQQIGRIYDQPAVANQHLGLAPERRGVLAGIRPMLEVLDGGRPGMGGRSKRHAVPWKSISAPDRPALWTWRHERRGRRNSASPARSPPTDRLHHHQSAVANKHLGLAPERRAVLSDLFVQKLIAQHG
jgi:hypothetical protein